jgi:hypothetical protein
LDSFLPGAFPRGSNDLFGLAAELSGHLPVCAEYLLGGEILFAVAGRVCRNLGGLGTGAARFFKLLPYLP